MSLTREEILAMDDLPTVEIKIPEWGGTVFVRTMTAGQRDRFEASVGENPGSNIRARLAVLTVCDAEGTLLFTEKDIPLLSLRSARALSRVFSVAVKLNGISNEDSEALEKSSRALIEGEPVSSPEEPLTLDGPHEDEDEE